MIAGYFLVGFVVVIGLLYVYNRLARKPKSEAILDSFATTLVALLTREIAGEVSGRVDVNLYFVEARDLHVHFGGVGPEYYVGLIIAFLATFIAFGGYLYSKKNKIEA